MCVCADVHLCVDKGCSRWAELGVIIMCDAMLMLMHSQWPQLESQRWSAQGCYSSPIKDGGMSVWGGEDRPGRSRALWRTCSH